MALGIGAAMLGGSLLGLGGSLFGMSASAKQAKNQMDFQEKMSNTAYSRGMRDMRDAGLNPVLAAGGPASTPSGAMGQTPDFGGSISRAANSAIAARSAGAQIKRTEAQAAIGGVEAELDQRMLVYFDKLPPTVRDAQSAARLARASGVSSTGAAATEALSASAYRAYMRATRRARGERVVPGSKGSAFYTREKEGKHIKRTTEENAAKVQLKRR